MTDTQGSKAEKERKAGIPPLELQVVAERTDRRLYQLGELLSYHDRAFVINAYLAIAKREPTQEELAQTLAQLRAGVSKTNIVANLSASQSNVRVEGLPASQSSRVTRWPVIGYVLRVLKALGRLPLLIKHQQEFETFALAQQQQIADYINDVLAPAFMSDEGSAASGLAATVSDAVAAVSMLADSLVDLSAQQADLQTRLQKLQEQRAQSEAQLHADLVGLSEHLASINRETQQRHEEIESGLHADLVSLTEQLGELRANQSTTAAAQREFLVEEQRLIVEAQQLAINDLQDQLTSVVRKHEDVHRQLTVEAERLRSLIEPLPPASAKAEARQGFEQT